MKVRIMPEPGAGMKAAPAGVDPPEEAELSRESVTDAATAL
jgi:hypothetical protein